MNRSNNTDDRWEKEATVQPQKAWLGGRPPPRLRSADAALCAGPGTRSGSGLRLRARPAGPGTHPSRHQATPAASGAPGGGGALPNPEERTEQLRVTLGTELLLIARTQRKTGLGQEPLCVRTCHCSLSAEKMKAELITVGKLPK